MARWFYDGATEAYYGKEWEDYSEMVVMWGGGETKEGSVGIVLHYHCLITATRWWEKYEMEWSCDMSLEAIQDMFCMKISSEHTNHIMDQRQRCTLKPRNDAAVLWQCWGSDAIV